MRTTIRRGPCDAASNRWTHSLGLFLVGIWAALLGAGCQPTEMTPPEDTTPLPAGTLQVGIGPLELQPGQEVTRCVTVLLPSDVPVDITKLSVEQISTHHVILYREQAGATENTTPTDCPPLDVLSTDRAPLFIGETERSELALPPNVVYRLTERWPLRIEGHFFNPRPMAVQASARILLATQPVSKTAQEADMMFLNAATALDKKYDTMRSGLPPLTVTSTPPIFYAIPDTLVDAKFFALTSHQHRLGTDFVISRATSSSEPGTEIYRNTDWEHAKFLQFPDADPLRFQPGEGFRWICTFNNTTTDYIKFGQSATKNEMCILWAYYYPAQGFRVVFL